MDADLFTVAAIESLLGFTSEPRLLHFGRTHLVTALPYLPDQTSSNKRLCLAAAQMNVLIFLLAQRTNLFYDDVFVVDSTPVACGRSRPTAHRSELVGFAGYGYCASPSRFFWGLHQLIESVNDTLKGRLHLERHGGRTAGGVIADVCQRLLAHVATIWFHRQTGQPVTRSLIAHGH